MTRSELIARLAKRHPELSTLDVKLAVAQILKSISSTLANDGRVEIRGFGTIRISKRPPRKGRNPKTGGEVELPERKGILFRPAMELRERVNINKRPAIMVYRHNHPPSESFIHQKAA